MKKILICGDSFTTDFGISESWVTRLAQVHQVDNLSRAGISEYKILKQLESKQELLGHYDLILVSHTSPNRVHIDEHSIHKHSKTHHQSDLLFSDVEYHLAQNPTDPVLNAAHGYFLHIFDPVYYDDLYQLMQMRIKEILQPYNAIHLTNFGMPNTTEFEQYIDIPKLLSLDTGNINHYTYDGNNRIFKLVIDLIETHGSIS